MKTHPVLKEGSIYAIIVAAGRSSRMGSRLLGNNKVYADIGGKPAIIYSIEKLVRAVIGLKGLIIVASHDEIDFCGKVIKKTVKVLYKEGFDLFIEVVPGGGERFESVVNGLRALHEKGCGKSDIVFIHDGARPNFPQNKINVMLSTLMAKNPGMKRTEGVTLALGSIDTLCRAGRGFEIQGYEERAEIWRVQTPQLFRYETLYGCALKVLERAENEEKVKFTDETSLLFSFNKKCVIVEGSASNIKITSPDDLDYIRGLMK
ncbi:MAG TPA: IspD/TarI family cytidylyltransferase [Candidatus Wallbacteria bacterium]|nr:IspD/TarI family cytidylyltransferase [Candidatus Wallbacteria bacterium]